MASFYKLSLDQPDSEIDNFSNLLKVWQYINAWCAERELSFVGYARFSAVMKGKTSHLFRVADINPAFKVERKAIQ